MRTFKVGTGEKRKVVSFELDGTRLLVTKDYGDGTRKQTEKVLRSEAAAHAAVERMVGELTAHGYKERNADLLEAPRPKTSPAAPSEKPAERAGGIDLGFLADAGEDSAEVAESLGPRLAPAATAEATPKKKRAGKKKKKKRKAAANGDALDKRVVAGFGAAGFLCAAVVGFLAYTAFLKPASIVGTWAGSKTEHEIGKYLINTRYRLVLDGQGHAAMAVNDGTTDNGTYAFAKDQINLTFTDEDGVTSQLVYKVKLGGATLDLFDPTSGTKVVQLIRHHDTPVVAKFAPPPAAPANFAAGPADPAADEKLASVPFGVKDGAFHLRHPTGWEVETGARPDNSYSWARFTKGSAKIRVFADVAGSLLAGPNATDNEGKGEFAPVQGAHDGYKDDAEELYGGYKESRAASFTGSGLGEGRICSFTGSGGGIFASKLKGIRVTFLSNDRRISVLCEAPADQFDKLAPAFLATCRSLSH